MLVGVNIMIVIKLLEDRTKVMAISIGVLAAAQVCKGKGEENRHGWQCPDDLKIH